LEYNKSEPREGGEAMRISSVNGLWAWTQLNRVNENLNNVMEQLSTGRRISRAVFDVAGIATTNRLRAQVEGYIRAYDNTQYGINLLNTAEGGMSTIQNNLQRMRELAVQASNGILTEADRAALQEEFNQLRQGITETVKNTQYNTQNVLQGYRGTFQIGANEGQTMEVEIPNMNPENLTANTEAGTVNLNNLNINTPEGARQAIEAIDQMINRVSETRANVGAYVNRLEEGARDIVNTMINTTATQSRIEDIDMARGVLEQTRLMLLRNFTTGVLAQSNISITNVLRLLG
jgi:flagellin